MLRKVCMMVKDCGLSSEITAYERDRDRHSLQKFPAEKMPVLLRFVSSRAMDFNAISTGFSLPKRPISRSKLGQNRA
jgi:hypothetical protein